LAVEGDIQTLLAALVSGRCYPLVAPELVVKPYIVYSVISNVPSVSLDGPTDTEQRRIQVDVWGETYASVKGLEVTIKSTMAGSSIVNIPLSTMDLYESETKLFRISMDFSVWITG
jgi:hypothetical protein